jgi:ABC-type phosphate transport system auxiliary subunit
LLADKCSLGIADDTDSLKTKKKRLGAILAATNDYSKEINTMEDYEIVSIESELDRLRDEKENSDIAGKNSGCAKTALLIILGIVIFKIFLEVVSMIK